MNGVIIGAGLAGLIAAYIFPDHDIIEAGPAPAQSHKALLRFRSDKVSRLTRIPFKEVTVRKGIFWDNDFVQPTIRAANNYSLKVTGTLIGDRSIWNLDPVQRFLAPENFYDRLIRNSEENIVWGKKIDHLPSFMKEYNKTHAISTMPLPVLTSQLGMDVSDITFCSAGIKVMTFRVRDCNLYQTVYFPSNAFSLYRASISGDLLIAEFSGVEGYPQGRRWMDQILIAFGLSSEDQLTSIETVSQRYGKIAPIDDNKRKRIIGAISEQHNIYSLGRFATWKNILLDDVVDDATTIQRLIEGSEYDKKLHNTKG